MKTFLLLILLSLICVANASEQLLTSISVSGEVYTIDLVLVVDDKADITKFKLIEMTKGKVVSNKDFETSGAHEGIVLMQESGKDVVKLQSSNFTEYNGGEVFLDYLYNGINGKRKKIAMDLSREADQWILSIDGKRSTKLHFVKNKKPLIGVIGIKKIEVR